uniref:Uncharacterized protein n=1 Tax=Rhabditophanes sp. KR3021 TaxID=114890 RepID=A0AC35TIX1_9BILA
MANKYMDEETMRDGAAIVVKLWKIEQQLKEADEEFGKMEANPLGNDYYWNIKEIKTFIRKAISKVSVSREKVTNIYKSYVCCSNKRGTNTFSSTTSRVVTNPERESINTPNNNESEFGDFGKETNDAIELEKVMSKLGNIMDTMTMSRFQSNISAQHFNFFKSTSSKPMEQLVNANQHDGPLGSTSPFKTSKGFFSGGCCESGKTLENNFASKHNFESLIGTTQSTLSTTETGKNYLKYAKNHGNLFPNKAKEAFLPASKRGSFLLGY